MRFGVLGTGSVGRSLATKLVELGHEAMMGSRAAGNEKAVEWMRAAGDRASEGSFADAAEFGEVVVNATAGTASLDALALAGHENLAGKILIDVANPLDFSGGMPPTLSVCNDDSLGEQIQRAVPAARVVKTLNTISADLMVAPDKIPGRHNLFVSGNDDAAKTEVIALLESFGWSAASIIDLGDISTARGTEMYLALWIRLMGTLRTPQFNFEIRRPA